jgi:aubergine-like protein
MKKLKEPYKFIKSKMYKFGIMSQVVLLYTINKRKPAIDDKILLKIMMRFGSDLWRLNLSPALLMPHKIMIVGIESANQSAVTYVSSYNQFCSKFYVQIVKSEVKIEAHRRLLNLAPYFKRSLSIFKASASSYPDLVIIYRKGKSEEECITFIGQEIASLEDEIKNIQTTEKVGNLPLVFLTYNTRSSLRAFQFDSYAVQNPREAILIEDDHIIPKAEQVGISYEFFLKPQNCTVGSSNFTHYRVHRLPAEIKNTTLAEFTLCQCFGYFGFTGGIRIPAICQYAKRAAEKYALTGQEPSVDISKEKYAY